MDALLNKLKTNWEVALFWAMLVALLGTLLVWLLAGDTPESTLSKGSGTNRQSLLGDNAFAFLDPATIPDLPSNPFSFGYKAEQKRPWRMPTNTTRPVATPATKPTPNVAPTPVPTPAANPTPPTPAVPKAARVLTYRGYMQTASGQMVAFMTVTDPIAKKTRMEQLSIGRKIDGIEIKDFTPDSLEVVGPKGDSRRIPKGGRKKIELE